VATVSKFSADEIAKYYGVKRKNIEIIPESGEHILKEIPDYSLHEKFNLEEGSYFLAVSSYARNKNFSSVVRAVAKLSNRSFKFVVVGGRDATIFNENGIDVSGAVEVGYVTDPQLRALYERAACFVFPSLYEGWGLPPMEAMACGCPVLVSNTSALPEVCGYGAAYCDPYDVDDIAKQLDRLLGSEQARNELREAGLARTKEWTWANAARRLSEIRL
jgi:glycosyltransferase involved in cell wall biosynthesis